MLLLYNFLSFVALILYFPFLVSKKGPENKPVFIKQRLGISSYAETDIWLHAVSVGEILAALPFLKSLKAEFPDKRIVISTTTYTGQKIARDKFPEADRIMYMPIDTSLCVTQVVNALRPKLFINIETELWPMLFSTLKSCGSSIVTLNGRISNDSFKGYSKIKFLMKMIFSNIDFLYMQSEIDAERIISLGADTNKVAVMGNFKFDFKIDRSADLDWLDNIKGKVFLAASTHRGEDEILLNAYNSVKVKYSDLKLIIAPRHPERFDEVAELIDKIKLKFIKRSALIDTGPVTSDYDVVLLDTVGELSGVFSGVDVAFIGGSLVPVGGHNILEPAYFSKPIIFGPHMGNFPIASEFLKQSAALQIRDAGDIADKVCDILEDNEKASMMGERARAIFDNNAGAVHKAIELIRSYIGSI